VADPGAEAVDLSSYGLQRVKLNHAIKLDDAESELEPQNPNPRGAHGGGKDTDPLDEIIRTFNKRWFQGWNTTPEEQRVRLLSMAESIKFHSGFQDKYKNNPDPHHRDLYFHAVTVADFENSCCWGSRVFLHAARL